MPNLKNLRVIDLTRILPGPYCTMLLADMGADVIKVERGSMGDPLRLTPPMVDDESLSFASLNRNKRSLVVNYRKQEGRSLLYKLLADADVFAETFKPGQMARYGLDYATIREINPGIIYCSLSGYGQTGPNASRSGHDLNFLALSGTLDLLRGPDGRPTIPGFQLADLAGGSLFAAIAILAALLERSVTGQGQYLDASIWQGIASLTSLQLAAPIGGLDQSEDTQGLLSGDLPGYNVYLTSDGRYMALAALEPVLWGDFCQAIGRQDLISRQFPEKAERAAIVAQVAAVFRQQTQAEWVALFSDMNICCEPVLSLREASLDRLSATGGNIVEIERPGHDPLRQLGSPRALSGDDPPARPAPRLGEHTVEILEELGLSGEEIARLRTDKVIATPKDVRAKRLRNFPY